MFAYKLVRRLKDGSLAPLFINKKQRFPIGKWLTAEAIPTKGFAFRPGFHTCATPSAPHLSKENRVWCLVSIDGFNKYERPLKQGGVWYTAQKMRIERVLDGT